MALYFDESLLRGVASIAAGLGGACFAMAWARHRTTLLRRRRAHNRGLGDGGDLPKQPDRIMRSVEELSRKLSLKAMTPSFRGTRFKRIKTWFEVRAGKAGVQDDVSSQGCIEASARLSVGAALLAALLGAVFSTELAVLGGVAGAVWGATAVARSMKRLTKRRTEGLDRDLPEMLEVVALGLRSGLSFDRSFGLYGSHFHSKFALGCAQAQRSWSFGLSTREDALRALALSYDSVSFSQVVEGMVRSLRFGSSLAEVLESAAAEARKEHRAHVEERVAKAPVKMMVPTGTLILPAMLLLVLGPVLLELMEGI